MVPPQWAGEETVGVQLLLWNHPRVLSCRLHPASHWWELDLPWISWELTTLPAVEPRLFFSLVIRETKCTSSRGLSWPLVWNLCRETWGHPVVRGGITVRDRHRLHVWNLEGAAWNSWYGRWHHRAGLPSGEAGIEIRNIGNRRSGCVRWR